MATILRLSNKDGSVSYQGQVRIKRGGKLVLNESRNFKVLGPGSRAEALAKRLAEDWSAALTEKMRPPGAVEHRKLAAIDVKTLIEQYIVFVEKDKPLFGSKRCVLKCLAVSVLGDLPVTDLTSERIIDYARGRRALGLKPPTIRMDILFLGVVLRNAKVFAQLDIDLSELSDASAYLWDKGVISASIERERRLQDGELGLILARVKATEHQRVIPVADIIRFAIETSMRLGEIIALRWGDLDEKRRIILVRNRKDPKKKIGNDQTVPLLGAAMSIVLAQPRTGELIFPYQSTSISAAFSALVAKVGIKDLHFHDLRHEGISRLFEQGYSIQEVAIVSGHKNWKSLKRYTQLRADDLHRDVPVVVTDLSERGDRR